MFQVEGGEWFLYMSWGLKGVGGVSCWRGGGVMFLDCVVLDVCQYLKLPKCPLIIHFDIFSYRCLMAKYIGFDKNIEKFYSKINYFPINLYDKCRKVE